MTKTLRSRLAALVHLACAAAMVASGQASAVNVCEGQGIRIAFFNGVKNTPCQAGQTLKELRRLHKTESPAGDVISYDLMYNETNEESVFEDFFEVFDQRAAEHAVVLIGRYELLFALLSGRDGWRNAIVEALPAAALVFDSMIELYPAALVGGLADLAADPATQEVYAEHRERIRNAVIEGQKLVFVAHSQGNLFVNPAYDFAVSLVGPDAVKVVHIAPASAIVNGTHVLADLDLVINALRKVGSVPPVTHSIPGFATRAKGRDGSTDPLGHGMMPIYLNERLGIYGPVRNAIEAAMRDVVAPTSTGSPGFFTATLSWDGFADVDLHVFEPDGSHVYYDNEQGTVGFLDIDNVIAYGPEHYFATCESERILLGDYRIAIANYARGEGNIAIVQLASQSAGVLKTQEIVLGPATGAVPTYEIGTIRVSQSAETGALRADMVTD